MARTTKRSPQVEEVRSLGIDQTETSSALLAKIVYAGTACSSFALGSDALHKLADLPIPEKQVEQLTIEE